MSEKQVRFETPADALAYVQKHATIDKKTGAITKPVGLRVLGAVDFLRVRGVSVRLPSPEELPGFPGADPIRWAAQKARDVLLG